MDLSIFTQYLDVVTVGICLCVGFVIKKWIKDIDNKYIPTIVTFLGLIISIMTKGLSPESILSGMISGLASTGLHQAFTQVFLGKKEEK